MNIDYDSIKAQFERYGGEPVEELRSILWALTDLNDNIAHLRSEECLRFDLINIRSHLDQLEAKLNVDKAAVSLMQPPNGAKFNIQDYVRKHSGAWWQGRVVGFYSTAQTPIGYCVQLDVWGETDPATVNGPVQIYPESALELVS